MIQDVLDVGYTDDVPGRVQHQAGHVIHPATPIYQVSQHVQVLETLNRHWYDQQAVIVGAGVKVVQPVRHLVGHDGSHRGIELVAVGLPDAHRFQVTTNDI